MSSRIDTRHTGRIAIRARFAQYLSYATAVLTAGLVIVFLSQAGLFQLLFPGAKPTAPTANLPEQVNTGPSTIEGLDNQNLPYAFSAQAAVQDKDVPHHVHLEALNGVFQRPGSQTYDISAQNGLYDTKLKTLDLRNDVKVIARGRFDASLDSAHVAVKEKTLTSEQPVTVTLVSGSTVHANGVKITDDGNRILFFNGVTANFKPSANKGDAQP